MNDVGHQFAIAIVRFYNARFVVSLSPFVDCHCDIQIIILIHYSLTHVSFIPILSIRNYWGGAKSLSLHRGNLNDDDPYAKSVVLHQWLFGYELPDTIAVLTEDGTLAVLATKKKCEFIKPVVGKNDKFKIKLLLRTKEDGNAENYQTLLDLSRKGDSENKKLGILTKERTYNKSNGSLVGPYEELLDKQTDLELVDIAPALTLVMAAKDETEWDLMKKSSVLSNKVMKHGFVKRLEEIIEEEKKITHENFAQEIEAILEDPNKIKLNVPQSDVGSCYFPIIQSGGNYDLKVSAQSTGKQLSHDIITVSLGARYKLYCSNISRTFLVDPPKKVSAMYTTLLEMQEECIKAMQPGSQLKAVYKAAVKYLKDNDHEDLIEKLPKNLGFCQGIDFRDSTLTLSAKNNVPFRPGMVFCLMVGFQNLELTEKDVEDTPSASPVSECTVTCDAGGINRVHKTNEFFPFPPFAGQKSPNLCSPGRRHGEHFQGKASRSLDEDGKGYYQYCLQRQ